MDAVLDAKDRWVQLDDHQMKRIVLRDSPQPIEEEIDQREYESVFDRWKYLVMNQSCQYCYC